MTEDERKQKLRLAIGTPETGSPACWWGGDCRDGGPMCSTCLLASEVRRLRDIICDFLCEQGNEHNALCSVCRPPGVEP